MMNNVNQQLDWAQGGWLRAEDAGEVEDWWFWKGYVTALEWVKREKPQLGEEP